VNSNLKQIYQTKSTAHGMAWHGTTNLRQLVRLEAKVGGELVLLRVDLDEHQPAARGNDG